MIEMNMWYDVVDHRVELLHYDMMRCDTCRTGPDGGLPPRGRGAPAAHDPSRILLLLLLLLLLLSFIIIIIIIIISLPLRAHELSFITTTTTTTTIIII